MNGALNIKKWPHLPGPWEGSKGQISFNFNYKVNFIDFYSKLCVCSHIWKIQNISDGFFILSPGSCPRGRTWEYLGAKIKFCPAVCPLCYLLNHWKKIQPNLVCELLPWMGRATSIFFSLPPGALWRGQKVKYHFISVTKSSSKIFIPNFVCVLTNERYKTYQTRFSLCSLGHAPGMGLRGAWGAQVVKKSNFQTWSCGISNRRGWRAEQNASKIFILGSNWWLWGEVKGQISLNSGVMSISKIFIPNFVCVLTNERYKTYQTGFLFCHLGHA